MPTNVSRIKVGSRIVYTDGSVGTVVATWMGRMSRSKFTKIRLDNDKPDVHIIVPARWLKLDRKRKVKV